MTVSRQPEKDRSVLTTKLACKRDGTRRYGRDTRDIDDCVVIAFRPFTIYCPASSRVTPTHPPQKLAQSNHPVTSPFNSFEVSCLTIASISSKLNLPGPPRALMLASRAASAPRCSSRS